MSLITGRSKELRALLSSDEISIQLTVAFTEETLARRDLKRETDQQSRVGISMNVFSLITLSGVDSDASY
jgi:hypothetical protein